MNKFYTHELWKKFRQEKIELDGNCCGRCNRSIVDGVILQVHHKFYIRHKLPWEYDYSDCETLCKGCHAAEHGHIRPRMGWDYLTAVDLGDLSGSCELCGTELRYVYYVHHPKWEPMGVGTVCCDALTGTNIASVHTDAMKRRHAREERFINSSRWTTSLGIVSIKQKDLYISIAPKSTGFQIQMNGVSGKIIYQTMDLAKRKVFEVVENGKAANYLERRQTASRADSPKLRRRRRSVKPVLLDNLPGRLS